MSAIGVKNPFNLSKPCETPRGIWITLRIISDNHNTKETSHTKYDRRSTRRTDSLALPNKTAEIQLPNYLFKSEVNLIEFSIWKPFKITSKRCSQQMLSVHGSHKFLQTFFLLIRFNWIWSAIGCDINKCPIFSFHPTALASAPVRPFPLMR